MAADAAAKTTASARSERLRASGYRLTAQRELVLEAIDRLGHATPEQVAAEVRRVAGGVTLTTVQRTLDLLEQVGLTYHTHLDHHPSPTYHAMGREHIHLVCEVCNRVANADPALMGGAITALADVHGFEVDVRHLAIFGRCATCRHDDAASRPIED